MAQTILLIPHAFVIPAASRFIATGGLRGGLVLFFVSCFVVVSMDKNDLGPSGLMDKATEACLCSF